MAYLNVMDFGAKADGVTNDAPAVQAAIDLASRLAGPSVAVPGRGLFNDRVIFFPHRPGGAYKLDQTVEVPAGVQLLGEDGVLLFTKDATIPLLAIANYYNKINNFAFSGGKHAISCYPKSARHAGNVGSPTAISYCLVEGCKFRYQHGPSIYTDMRPHGRGGGIMRVTDFDFEGSCLFYGAMDYFAASHGIVQIDHLQSPPARYDDGRLMPFIGGAGSIDVFDVAASGSQLIVNEASTPAWFEVMAILRTAWCRFGETGVTHWRVRAHQLYDGVDLSTTTDTVTLAELFSNHDAISTSVTAGAFVKNLLEVYDRFPNIIYVNQPDTTLTAPAAGRDGLTSIGSQGIWVDSVSCPRASFLGVHKSATIIDFRGFVPNQARVRTSGDPRSVDGEELTSELLQYFTSDVGRSTEIGSPRKNLWVAGGAAEVDPSMCFGGIINGATVSGTDATLGYSVRQVTSSRTSDGANVAFFAWDSANPDGWGGSLPSGRYTLSCFVKANFGSEVLFSLDKGKPALGTARITESTEWQRVAVTFYHDGTAKKLGIGIYSIPRSGVLAVACPAVHEGETPAPYTRPGNPQAEQEIVERRAGDWLFEPVSQVA